MRLVILGAAGDLTARYLMPAVAELHEAGHLPEPFDVVGVGRDDMSDGDFRARVSQHLDDDAICGLLTYRAGDATDPELLASLLEGDGADGGVVLYLALPPQVFDEVLDALERVELPDQLTVVFEKPFGHDLDSARRLNARVEEVIGERRAFRIDHFLGHQTVQNVLGLRFANRMFEPVWNNQHVDRVEFVWDETLTVEGRAGFYDRTGSLKDMLQNHLLQLLCLVAMEPPLTLDADDVRDRKVDVLRAVRRVAQSTAADHSVRARYTAGAIDGRRVPDYVDEDGVEVENGTETFAELRLFIDNWRWSGVPFVLRSGKALAESRRQIDVVFRDVPHQVFDQPPGGPTPERLRLGINPDLVRLDIRANGRDDPTILEPASLSCELAPSALGPYANVLLDVINGDRLLSIRADEAEQAWRIIEPVLAAWEDDAVELQQYAAGSSGPARTLAS
jgi:glucose-6-phosphate 1-dehydrogenase